MVWSFYVLLKAIKNAKNSIYLELVGIHCDASLEQNPFCSLTFKRAHSRGRTAAETISTVIKEKTSL